MKTFIKENWFRLMTGTSMLICSIGFLIYATNPSYASLNSKEFIPLDKISSTPMTTISGITFIGTGDGIYYYNTGSPTSMRNWIKVQ
jgi:hypothetical protein